MAAGRVLWAGNQLQMTASDCVWSLSPSEDKTPIKLSTKAPRTPCSRHGGRRKSLFWTLKSSPESFVRCREEGLVRLTSLNPKRVFE